MDDRQTVLLNSILQWNVFVPCVLLTTLLYLLWLKNVTPQHRKSKIKSRVIVTNVSELRMRLESWTNNLIFTHFSSSSRKMIKHCCPGFVCWSCSCSSYLTCVIPQILHTRGSERLNRNLHRLNTHTCSIALEAVQAF